MRRFNTMPSIFNRGIVFTPVAIFVMATVLTYAASIPVWLDDAITEFNEKNQSIQFQFVSADETTLDTTTVHYDSGAIVEATLVAGYTLNFRLPHLETYRRYFGFIYTVSGNTTTLGNATSMVSPSYDAIKAYASGLTFHA